MKLEQSFEVDAPLQDVWDALIDVQRVAPCLPGAELTDASEEGVYKGTLSVKIGPAKASYNGTMTMEEVDASRHQVTMRATGTDKRGQGGAKALMHSTLTEREGGGTRVEVVTDLTITGRLASFSRGGMMQDVSNRLMNEFASCLQTSLAPAQATPEPTPAATAATTGDATAAGAATTPTPPPSQTSAPSSSSPPAAKPTNALSLFFGVLRDRLRRLFRRSR